MKFTIDSKTFKNITERASAVCAKGASIPVFSCVELVADKVGIPDNMVWGVNPNHVAEVFGSFGKSDVQIYTDGTRVDLWVICGDDGYKALILPVRLKDTTSVSALSFAQSA